MVVYTCTTGVHRCKYDNKGVYRVNTGFYYGGSHTYPPPPVPATFTLMELAATNNAFTATVTVCMTFQLLFVNVREEGLIDIFPASGVAPSTINAAVTSLGGCAVIRTLIEREATAGSPVALIISTSVVWGAVYTHALGAPVTPLAVLAVVQAALDAEAAALQLVLVPPVVTMHAAPCVLRG